MPEPHRSCCRFSHSGSIGQVNPWVGPGSSACICSSALAFAFACGHPCICLMALAVLGATSDSWCWAVSLGRAPHDSACLSGLRRPLLLPRRCVLQGSLAPDDSYWRATAFGLPACLARLFALGHVEDPVLMHGPAEMRGNKGLCTPTMRGSAHSWTRIWLRYLCSTSLPLSSICCTYLSLDWGAVHV